MLNYVTSTAAIISWSAVSGVTSYDLQIKKSTSASWLTFIKIPATVIQITNMQPSSTYEVRVRSHCSDNAGDVSDYTPILTINTLANLNNSEGVAALPDGNGTSVQLPELHDSPEELLIYPNPTTGWVTVGQIQEEVTESDFQWFDLNGRLLQVVHSTNEQGLRQFDLSQQAPGVYLLRVLGSDGHSIVRRVVRQ